METITIPFEILNYAEEPTMSLRWSKHGQLQQAFKMIQYKDGKVNSIGIDWRDIQTESEK